MKFRYNGNEYNLPVTLNEITVKQKIEFDRLYRDEVNRLYKEAFKINENGESEGDLDETDIMLFKISVATMNLSFFTNIPLKEVEENIAVDDVMNLYMSCFYPMYEEQEEIQLKEHYLFNGELWHIDAPYLDSESKVTFNQLITSKQIIKKMQEFAAGQYEAIPYLAAIYLKKEGETFQEEWLLPGNERLKQMEELPMDVANAVAFFLQSSMSMYLKTLAYSPEVEEPVQKGQI